MLSVFPPLKSLKRLVALLGLLAYVFLGIVSPESASALLVSMDGTHQVSVSSDFSGQSAIVLHHHALAKGHDDVVFHQRNRQVEPDHVFLFQKKADQASLYDLQSLMKLVLASLLALAGLAGLSMTPMAWMPQILDVPTRLAQPPPFRPLFSKIRRVTVLTL